MTLAVLLGACETDSPTAPTQTPNPPSTGGDPVAAYAISVNLSPRTVIIGEDTTVRVTITARRTDTNQPVPEGSTTVVSTTSGLLVNAAGTSGVTIPVVFDRNGTAQASLIQATETAVVRAQIENSTGQATLQVQEPAEEPPFFVSGVSPNFGPPSGGTQVRIEGSGFSAPVEVLFGSQIADVLSVSSNVIRVVTPAIQLPVGETQVVSVVVTINLGLEGQATDAISGAFTFTRSGSPVQPQIISVTPTSGPNEGGTQVEIRGEGLPAQPQVFFGNATRVEAEVLDVSSSRIVAVTPPAVGQNAGNQNQIVQVEVLDLASGARAVLPNAFQYGAGAMFISSAGPTEGIYLGGTLVTIFGQGFDEPVAVEFGGLAQQPISVTGTEIVARSVPIEISGCSRPSGPFRLTNIETNEVFESSIRFTYRPVEPRIDSVSPSSVTADVATGAIIGNPRVTIRGFGFESSPVPEVLFGTERGTNVVVFDLLGPNDDPLFGGFGVGTRLEVDAPDLATDFETETCDDDGDGNEGTRFVPTRVDVRVTNVVTGCFDVFSNGFTYVPSDTTCRDDAAPPPPPEPAVADFEAIVTPGSLTVQFLDFSQNAEEYLWNFGDGSTSTTPGDQTHTYACPGTYTVSLRVAGEDGVFGAPKTEAITVTQEPPPMGCPMT